jgi:hypothetical protein
VSAVLKDMQGSGRSSSVDELLQDFEEFSLGDLAVSVLVDGLHELSGLVVLHLAIAAQALEGVVDEIGDFFSLEGAALVVVVLVEDGIDCLAQLVVGRL